ncbi:Alkaline phytoceramidase (aPHC) [Hibiscus syriacus]|uniref:Alkaline phytoceramidase (APHC) n=1 Tax=Hibiscus syriacus TaxID=106335 RepID=A0A6A2ZBH2_HIBSY|nr:pathogen-associated molecular patterns-induced protein A70-like [Hibiscus syriacus]KAE8689097.1 Alkaline phytoceramidase (aPHC) [Hibiscus syriacus]
MATQSGERTPVEIYSQLDGENSHVARTKSDTKPASGELPTKLPRKMKKSATVKSAFRHFKVDDIVEARRPATVRDKAMEEDEEEDEVDAKADDFINKFKQQLKLQKLDSIIRYKEMVNRGSGRWK